MADSANMIAMTAAITALTNMIATIRAPARPPPVHDPVQEDIPFDLSTRAASQAYTEICAPLKDEWDGHVETFPSFIVSLQDRAAEGKWNAAAPNGILTFGTAPAEHNILTNYHSVTDAAITAAHTARRDIRAIQNSTAMFKCIKASIKGTLRDTIFTQSGNLPANTDGPTLFKKLTSFTSVASLQLSLLSFNTITSLNPFDYAFNISSINTKLMQLFVLCTTQHRILDDNERIQHTLNVYSKIQQPEVWAQWTRTKVDLFDENQITVCQDFMNTAVVKYNKINSTENGFKGSVHTVQEDIVALIATKVKKPQIKKKRKPQEDDVDDKPPKKKQFSKGSPPWLKHFKDENGNKYKIGDTKDFKGKTFHYCDTPNHRDRAKWHTHAAADCSVRKKWLRKQDEDGTSGSPGTEVNANEIIESDTTSDDDNDNEPQQDINALLATALNLVTDNDIVRDYIANAINAAAE